MQEYSAATCAERYHALFEALLAEGREVELAARAVEFSPGDLSEIVRPLSVEDTARLITLLPPDMAADLLAEIDKRSVTAVMQLMDIDAVADLVEGMPSDEATDLVAEQLTRVRERYGNTSLYVPYGTGSYNQLGGKWPADRLLNLFGGALGYYNSYSWACITPATVSMYGTDVTGNQRQDWLNSKYIIMWGWNPSEMRDGTNSEYFLKEARKKGARVVCIDPRMTLSAVAHADEWIAIRPGTDVAMMSAMAWVMITEGLYDADFVRRCCSGFDQGQMPPGREEEESYSDYILGMRDGHLEVLT